MKAIILFSLVYLCALDTINSQTNNTSKKIKYYQTWIYQDKEDTTIKGLLYELKDSSVVILISIQNSISKFDTSYLLEFHVNQIEKIKTRKKGSLGTGIIVGGLSGLVLGALTGLLLNDQPEYDNKPKDDMEYRSSALSVGLFGGLVGVVIGTISGTLKMSYKINNNWNDYIQNAGALMKKSYKHQLLH